MVDLVNPSQDLIHFVAKAFAFLMVLVLMGFTESLKWRVYQCRMYIPTQVDCESCGLCLIMVCQLMVPFNIYSTL